MKKIKYKVNLEVEIELKNSAKKDLAELKLELNALLKSRLERQNTNLLSITDLYVEEIKTL